MEPSSLPSQPVNTVSLPTPQQLQGLVSPAPVVASAIKKDISQLEKSWKSPAFWTHLLVQVLSWASYILASSNPLKYGSLAVSVTSLLAYLAHLTVSSKYI